MQKETATRASFKVFILLWVLWLVVILLTQSSFLNQYIQTKITHPVNFILRERLGETPPLANKLKVFALDDQTVSYIGNNEISLKDLTLFLENIARKKPKVIILDKVFAEFPKDKDAEYWLERLRQIGVPMYTGISFHNKRIQTRKELNIDRYGFHYKSYRGGKNTRFEDLPFHRQRGVPYAFAESYEGIFTGVGHQGKSNDGTIFPIFSYSKEYLIPYLAMYAGDIEIVNHELHINGAHVPVDRKGSIVLNHRPTADYYVKNAKSMRSMIRRARAGRSEKNLDEGDVAVVLFNFFTGATSFYEGPFGQVPIGMLMVAAANSAIQGTWIGSFDHEDILIVLMSLLGIFFGLRMGPIQYWGASLGVSITQFFLSIYVFSYHSFIVPWFLPIVAFFFSGLIFYVYQRLGSEFMKVQIEREYFSEKSLRLEEENKKIKLEERLNLGKAVQEILLPERMNMQVSKFVIGMKYESAQEMSGDWLYVWRTQEGKEHIILGDVVGKGPSAAIPVAVIIGVLGECEQMEMSIEDSIARINQRLVTLFKTQITTTCAAISLKEDGNVTFYNAGSPGWFVFAAGKNQYLPLRSSSLGLSLEHVVESIDLETDKNMMAFTFTDGYLEGARAFKKLIRNLEKHEDLNVDIIHNALDEVGVDFRLEDDRSLLSVKLVS